MTYTATVIKNIRWQCITCNNIVADEAFEQLLKDEKNVRICPHCNQSIGWGILADPVQQRLG